MNIKMTDIVNQLINEGHDDKDLRKFLKWAESQLGWTYELIGIRYNICPPDDIKVKCYSTHKSSKGLFDIIRAFAKIYGVKKVDVENAFRMDVSLPKPTGPIPDFRY